MYPDEINVLISEPKTFVMLLVLIARLWRPHRFTWFFDAFEKLYLFFLLLLVASPVLSPSIQAIMLGTWLAAFQVFTMIFSGWEEPNAADHVAGGVADMAGRER
jgi:hypothetical protein